MRRAYRFGRKPVDEEVDGELAFHLEMATRDLMLRGMTETQARAEAERRFGDQDSVNAECRRYGAERDRRVDRAEYLDELRQDIGFAFRQLRKSRAFSAVAIITLALGIGATAAVFSALDAVVLRPLPFDHPERIVELTPRVRGNDDASSATVPEFLALRDSRAFEHIAASVLSAGFTIKIGDVPEMIGGGKVSADYFNVFGAQPMLGRTFTKDEDTFGGPRVVVISHRWWTARFNSDVAVIGRTVSINGNPHVIVGVMPASFEVTRDGEDLWVPIAFPPQQFTEYDSRFLGITARLRPDQTIAQARTVATGVERRLAERVPDRANPVNEWNVGVRRFADRLVGDYRSLLFILLGAVGFVLLIACSNVANLLLARGALRSRELAIRAALGAGRARLVRQLLTESLVLACAGAAVGLAVAWGLIRVIVAVSPADVPRLDKASVDWRVLAFTLLLAFTCSVLFGLVPALRAARPRIQESLQLAGRGNTGVRDRLRAILISAEVALAITLLVGSGLLIRSAWLMQRVDPGFNPTGVLTARLLLPESRYQEGRSVVRAFQQLRENAARIPGVRSAAIASVVPLSGSSMHASIRAAEQPRGVRPLQANFRMASDGYFGAMGIPLIAGREIEARDDAGAAHVIVINEALARTLWPGVDPRQALGRRIDALSASNAADLREVVGVVANLHDDGLAVAPAPEFYIPVTQAPDMLWPLIQRSLVLVLRSANDDIDPATLERPLARAVAQFDPLLPLADSRTMTSLLKDSLATARMNTLLLSILGGIALALAMVGVYGVISYFVNQRTQEIGIRMALGATSRQIWTYVVRRGLTPIAAGVIAGLLLSSATTRLLESHLYGVSPNDPLTLVAAALLLLTVGLVATYAPARRAMRIPPTLAMS